MQVRGERAVDDRDPFVPGRLPAADDSAVGLLEREVRGMPFRGRGPGRPGAVVDGGAGVGFHPDHGRVRAGLGAPWAGVDEGGDRWKGHFFLEGRSAREGGRERSSLK
jgi:hypothetical protein